MSSIYKRSEKIKISKAFGRDYLIFDPAGNEFENVHQRTISSAIDAMQRAGKGSEAWRSGKRVMKHFVK